MWSVCVCVCVSVSKLDHAQERFVLNECISVQCTCTTMYLHVHKTVSMCIYTSKMRELCQIAGDCSGAVTLETWTCLRVWPQPWYSADCSGGDILETWTCL